MNKQERDYYKQAAVSIDLEIGDVVMTGRYKNRRTVVKELGTDELGHPTMNGQKLLALRIEKLLPKKMWSSKTLAEDANEKEARDGGISYGCAMLYLADAGDKALSKWKKDMKTLVIPKEDLHEYGRESDPHVTVLYGIHTTSANKVKAALKKGDRTMMTVRMGKLAIFENDDFDVLIRKVERKDHLKEVRKTLMDNLKATVTFPDYKPHATIAYLKKGKGKEYLKKYKDTKWALDGEFDCGVIDFSNKGEDTCCREGSLSCDGGQLRRLNVTYPALFDPGSTGNPLIGCIDQLLQVVIGKNIGRHALTPSRDFSVGHIHS